MLHSLRNTIENDTLWFSILHEFYDNHKIKSANRDDFINLVNRRTKKIIQLLFTNICDGKLHLRLNIELTKRRTLP